MRRRVAIPNIDGLAARYRDGATVADLVEDAGVSPHMLRRRFVEMGVMRPAVEATKLAYAQGRMDNRKTNAGYVRTPEANQRHTASMQAHRDATSRGWRISSQGYYEYTRGEKAGKRFHVEAMEQWIGRPLRDGEIVHHIDRDKSNNSIDNLALVTASGHGRLHRFEDKLEGKKPCK